MEARNIIDINEQQFNEVVDIIAKHRSKASRAVNEQSLLCAWYVGGYVSKNMVMFYDEYSSEAFTNAVTKYMNAEFVQSKTGQIEDHETKHDNALTVQSETAQIVQSKTGQMPTILTLTTLTNHIEILCRCKSVEERLFYILYAHKQHLLVRELQRCISNQTYSALLSNKTNLSKGLLDAYPNAPIMFKDTYFVDFLNLPKKHSESKLKHGLIEHMKQFILELGKDFIFMDQEYRLNVGASTFKRESLHWYPPVPRCRQGCC